MENIIYILLYLKKYTDIILIYFKLIYFIIDIIIRLKIIINSI